jgi:hypothetical protein
MDLAEMHAATEIHSSEQATIIESFFLNDLDR